jgi:PST family polysaccharide transporter
VTEAAASAARPGGFIRDVALSGAAAGAVMLSQVVVTGWLASGLGPRGFGVYALARRLMSAVTSVTPGPAGVALARALALARTERERAAYLTAGAIIGLGPALAVALVGLAFAPSWAAVFLSGPEYSGELVAALGLVLGTSVYTIVFARLRGVYQIGRANLWQLWGLALGPLLVVAAVARRGSVALILWLMALVLGTAIVPLAQWLRRAARAGLDWPEVRLRLRELLAYAVPRVPGGAAFGAFLAVGPFLAPYFGDLREAGYLLAGQSVLRVVEGATAGFGLVALPRITAMQAGQRHEFLRDRVADIVSFVLHLGLFGACQLWIWAPALVRVWLGPAYEAAIPIVRVLCVALAPYLGYTLLRSVIDGLEERPVNTHNLYAALLTNAGLSLGFGLLGYGAFGLALASAAGFLVLGLLTVLFLRTRLGFQPAVLAIPSAVLLNGAAALLALGVKAELASRLSDLALATSAVGLTVALFAIYLAALGALQVRWLLEVRARVARRSSPP